MAKLSNQEQKQRVSEVYAERIATGGSCCPTDAPAGLYPVAVLAEMPEGVETFGCGNPVALASLRPGERVLDLGSGAGLDCFLAAWAVGPTGHVTGVDFTQAMLERANENAAKLRLTNVSFKQGDIEALPLDGGSIDVVISNCVINLAPDKDAVFREAFRVLRPGGRVMVSDILLTRPATEEEQSDLALLAGCISGSLPQGAYANKLRNAGFADVKVDVESQPHEREFWSSAAISAVKPR